MEAFGKKGSTKDFDKCTVNLLDKKEPLSKFTIHGLKSAEQLHGGWLGKGTPKVQVLGGKKSGKMLILDIDFGRKKPRKNIDFCLQKHRKILIFEVDQY